MRARSLIGDGKTAQKIRHRAARLWFPQLDRGEPVTILIYERLLLKEYMKLELTAMPEPEIAADEVLIRVRACGICGSDVHGLDGSTGRRIPPLVMGHEAAGEVAAMGRACTGCSWATA